MCGIAGILHYANNEGVSFDMLHGMTRSIEHRGPDDEGFYLSPDHHCGLGHRRLSIIDLASGKQPISNAGATKHIVFNGEIYNYRELRDLLLRKGHSFSTKTDTEVILALYEEFGVQAFARLNGIFAVAIYDEQQRQLVLARDSFGVKPLYYADHGGSLAFGSEIKSVLHAELCSKELNLQALDTFLDYRFNPAPQTMFKGVEKLLPGHILLVRQGCTPRLFPISESRPRTNLHISEDEARFEYTRLLRQAVQRQMMSDVPVGILLSGGVDSAIIARFMTDHAETAVRSYSIGFEGSGDFNELNEARQSAELLGTSHNELSITRTQYLEFFEKSFYFLEEPIAMSTIPAMFYVSQLASRDVKVVLAGQGADEPLAGYPRYRGEKFLSDYGWLLNKLPLQKMASLLPRNERVKRLAYSTAFRSELERFRAIHTIFHPDLKKRILKSELNDAISSAPDQSMDRLYALSSDLNDSLSRLLYIDTRHNLADNLLLFNDKMSMANSIEMRVPFLDHELVAFLETLPSSLKIRGSMQKYLHKKACEAVLPSEIVHRKKRGFATPIDEWLQNDLAKTLQRLFNERDSAVREYFNLHTINQMILLHQTRRENYQRHLFALLSFELWHRNFFNQLRSPSSIERSGSYTLI